MVAFDRMGECASNRGTSHARKPLMASLTRRLVWVVLTLCGCARKSTSEIGASTDSRNGIIICNQDSDCPPDSLCACTSDKCSIFPNFSFVVGSPDHKCFDRAFRLAMGIPIRKDGGWTVERDPKGRVLSTVEDALSTNQPNPQYSNT